MLDSPKPPEGWQPINVDDLFKVIGEQTLQIRLLQATVAKLQMQLGQETDGKVAV